MQAEDILILQIEQRFYRHAGSKWAAVRDELGLDPTQYAQLLNRLLDDPEAALVAPSVVNRLRRIREQRTRHTRPARAS